MRDFLDSILEFIAALSLTDDEYATCTSTLPLYDQDTYSDLARVLETRENVSVMQDRLTAFYKAKGVEFTPLDTGKSNIFIGSVL